MSSPNGCYGLMLVMPHSLPEKGEVLSDHYKLIPADLRDVQRLSDIITRADMDPRYVLGVILSLPRTVRKFC